MSNDQAWDSDVYSTKYANEFTMDLSVGLNAIDPPEWGNWECAWYVDANSIIRAYKDGTLVTVRTPEPGLPVALLGELAGVEIVADDVVSMTYGMDSGAIEVSVNDRVVVIGAERAGGCEWWPYSAHNTAARQEPISGE
jgi:hypothetical protein